MQQRAGFHLSLCIAQYWREARRNNCSRNVELTSGLHEFFNEQIVASGSTQTSKTDARVERFYRTCITSNGFSCITAINKNV
ncbi:hypothetical protein DPMN_149504 [Dreissena polymorpha]|uniref:Uncharacterized protein n=1 Tax=Dreissena polymorpha TaxID=45954 RepID=A0A9D4FCU1_DREPO|nr:hypothetical protein DPMN_149504 [Dreissena polymorpha]